jgi:hypothetical protein
MELEKNFEKKHRANINRAKLLVDRNLKWSQSKIAQLFAGYDIRNPESFKFRNDKILNDRLMKILTTLSVNMNKNIVQSQVISWGLANQKNDFLTNQFLQNIHAADGVRKDYFSLNIPAMNEFINRIEDGMNLSDRIWVMTGNYKAQLETYLGTGITAGRSAAGISSDVRYLLTEPDKLFRRIRSKGGNLVLSKAAKVYHPGAGMYRSAYKNAMRLTATETNMAYRMSDYTRRQQLDFVMGYRIHISHSHPKPDICDRMAGDYPKDFMFRGWHPWCLCFTTSILMSGSEYKRMQETGISPKRRIKDISPQVKQFLTKNRDKLIVLALRIDKEA